MLKLELPFGLDSGARVLLHSCCAPCSGAVIECLLANGVQPVVFFSNSNIVPAEEYELRRRELERYCNSLGVRSVNDEYDHADWLSGVLGSDPLQRAELASAPERGERCMACFKYRLLRAARYAEAEGFDLLTTTLASSRWKDLDQVNAAGEWACTVARGGESHAEDLESVGESGAGVRFWAQNWRKGGLQPRRAEIIQEQCFYNQLFCGCEFSKNIK